VRLLSLASSAFALSCAAGGSPVGAAAPPLATVVASATSAPSLPPAEPPLHCDEPGVSAEGDDIVSYECWPATGCAVSVPLVVVNCTERPLRVAGLVLTHPDVGFAYSDGPVVAPHARTHLAYPLAGEDRPLDPGAHDVAIRLESLDGVGAPYSAATRFTLVDTAKDRARAACAARGDDWGNRGGIIFDEGCTEVMPDAGRVCHDARDCQGYCELLSERQISSTRKRLTGRCTRHRTPFGCRVFIGETDHGWVPAAMRLVRSCVD
jgi:hypothetical protein